MVLGGGDRAPARGPRFGLIVLGSFESSRIKNVLLLLAQNGLKSYSSSWKALFLECQKEFCKFLSHF
jgi:hypothetical protein